MLVYTIAKDTLCNYTHTLYLGAQIHTHTHHFVFLMQAHRTESRWVAAAAVVMTDIQLKHC